MYSDANSGGNSTVEPANGKFEMTKDGDGFAAVIKGKTGNKLGWDFVGLGVTLGEKSGCPGGGVPVDLSKYSTLTFKAKGDLSGGRLIVNIPYSANNCGKDESTVSLTDWADYEIGISSKVGKDWSTVKIDLKKDLKQPKWAKKTVSISEVLKNAHNINWHFSSADGDTIELWIKDVVFE